MYRWHTMGAEGSTQSRQLCGSFLSLSAQLGQPEARYSPSVLHDRKQSVQETALKEWCMVLLILQGRL